MMKFSLSSTESEDSSDTEKSQIHSSRAPSLDCQYTLFERTNEKNRDQDTSTESDSASSSPARLESTKKTSLIKSIEEEDYKIDYKTSIPEEKIDPPMLDLQEENKNIEINQAISSQNQAEIDEENKISTPPQLSICHDIAIQTDPINSKNSDEIIRRSGRLAAKKDQKAPLSLKRKLKNPKNPNPKRIKPNENI